MVVKTLLDSRELAFLIRQIDEYIQVIESPDPQDARSGYRRTRIGEESQEKAACRQTGRTWVKERSPTVWLGGAALVSMMESPDLDKFHNAAVRWFLNWS